MTVFSYTSKDDAVVPVVRSRVWETLTDPTLLPELTPLLRSIEADGDTWRWEMVRISALGVSIEPFFTERMVFTPETEIEYHHVPPEGTRERTGAEGWYRLSDVDSGTRLQIALTLHVDLPLPKASGPAVRGVMRAMMDRTGDRFAKNLQRHLGVV